MFDRLTNRELASVLLLVIAIFAIKPIPLFPDDRSDPQPQIFRLSQVSQIDDRQYSIRADN
jgi:hypothetical protein